MAPFLICVRIREPKAAGLLTGPHLRRALSGRREWAPKIESTYKRPVFRAVVGQFEVAVGSCWFGAGSVESAGQSRNDLL